jgi:transposase
MYMARTSTPWRLLPARELGCGSPATCWRRLTEWANAGVFDQLHLQVLDRLGEQGQLGTGERGHHERARQTRGDHVGANPVDRGKPGSKLHMVCDDGGVPLSVVVTAATSTTPPCSRRSWPTFRRSGRRLGRRRTRPAAVHADKGYDSQANRAYLRRRGIRARIARRQIQSSTRLGRHRWKVERSLSWLSCFRRLQVCWDRNAGRWFAFVLVTCAVVCFTRL